VEAGCRGRSGLLWGLLSAWLRGRSLVMVGPHPPMRPRARYAPPALMQLRFTKPSRELPDRAVLPRVRGRLGRRGLVGSDRLAVLRAGLVAAFPVVLRASERLAGRLAAGRAEGWARAHARVVPFRREAGASPPGSYRIHRDGLVLWRPGHRPSLAASVVVGTGEPLGSRRRGRRDLGGESPSQSGVARQREPVSSPRRPR
jgi:hypothetical protein